MCAPARASTRWRASSRRPAGLTRSRPDGPNLASLRGDAAEVSLMSRSAFLALALLLATPAFAHPGAGPHGGFAHGFAHPILGFDHVLAMVSVGLWAGLVGGRAVWAWPAAFVAVMAAG